MDYQINQKSRERETLKKKIEEQRPTPSTATQCAICLNDLERDRIISALDLNWHIDCFRCSVCDVQLSHWYFEKDGLLFCRDDYLQRFGDACQQCSAFISGPAMIVDEHKFHPECFCCGSCQQYIGDGDSYALVERSKLFCGHCYHRQIDPRAKNLPKKSIELSDILQPSSSKQSPQKTLPHSIRLVEIPWTTENKNVLRLSVDGIQSGAPSPTGNQCTGVHISQIATNTESASLHIGDKILEVNGTPVTGKSIENIDELIQSSNNDVLQLTIEHDPHRLKKSVSEATIVTQQPAPISPNIKCREVCCSRSPSVREPPTIKYDRTFMKQHSQNDVTETDSTSPYASTSKVQQMCKNKTSQLNCAIGTNNLKNQKERCSSMSKLLDEQHSPTAEFYDLSRTKSFRVDAQEPTQRIFRASDLVIGELLGKGFFGQVFKVTHKVTKEVMVLKELYRVDEEAQRSFLKEVAVLRSLSHGNVLRFIGVLYREKKLHLVTEFVPGGSLKELIQNVDLVLPWECRIRFAKDIACGMAYLHSKNIIHRDLNSLNCLVREDKTVIVADFGLARIIKSGNSKSSNRLLVDGNGTVNRKYRQRRQRYTVVGNPYWMAPEMMKMMKYDERVDIFSFGIVLCEIIGRVQADPDYLPRTSDFGLNQMVFREKFCTECPDLFYKIAFLCCDLNPDARPTFEILDVWLESLAKRVATGRPHSSSLRYEIENFKETSTANSSPSMKRIDTKLSSSRSPSPLSKKSDFTINKLPSAERMDICDSKTITAPLDVSKSLTSNGINCNASKMLNTNTITNTNSKSNVHDDNTHTISHTNISRFSPSETIIESVPSLSNADRQQLNENNGNESTDDSLSFREIREIPKSPHLSKDFSPNGERLRSSIRFRRQERLQKQRSLRSLANMLSQKSAWDFNGEHQTSNKNENIERIPNYFNNSKLPFSYMNVNDDDSMPVERRKSKPYGEKGFIIQVNDGSLTLNDVQDLNNCCSDDFDSSCDTSLNYIDPDSLNSSIDLCDINQLSEQKLHSPKILQKSFNLILPEIDEKPNISLDEVRENLNKCKSKLDALELVDSKIAKNIKKSKLKQSKQISLDDVLSNDKPKPSGNANNVKSTSVFTRLHPISSPILNSRSSNPKNQTAKSSNVSSPTKTYPPKRESNLQSPTKNYSKHTMSFIEKINDGLNDRPQRSQQNGNADAERKSGNKKVGNKTKSNYTRSGFGNDLPMELLTTKPPAPVSIKKRNDGNKSITNNKNGDKTKKSNNLHTTSTPKRS